MRGVSEQQVPRVRCGVCRRVLDYGTAGNALSSRPHLPVTRAERVLMQKMTDVYGPGFREFEDIEGRPTGPKEPIALTPDLEAQLATIFGNRGSSSSMEWRCPGRGSAKGRAGHVHQVRRDRWHAFLEQRKAEGREGDDVFLGVDV